LAETALWLLPEGLACVPIAIGRAKANVLPKVFGTGWHKITRLFNFSFSGACESLRLFELKKTCGREIRLNMLPIGLPLGVVSQSDFLQIKKVFQKKP